MKAIFVVLVFLLPFLISAQTETPIVTFAGKPSGSYLTNEYIENGELEIVKGEGDIVCYTISSMSFGEEFTIFKKKIIDPALTCLKRLKTGQVFYIEEIKVKLSDSSIIHAPTLKYFKDGPNTKQKLEEGETLFSYFVKKRKIYVYPILLSNDTSRFKVVSFRIQFANDEYLDGIGNELTDEMVSKIYYYKTFDIYNIKAIDAETDDITDIYDWRLYFGDWIYKIKKENFPEVFLNFVAGFNFQTDFFYNLGLENNYNLKIYKTEEVLNYMRKKEKYKYSQEFIYGFYDVSYENYKEFKFNIAFSDDYYIFRVKRIFY
ncbi:MAG: hypothetical protein JXL97_09145 [Bacteroidales bacterium]|nr:hypothetical protein [Bacteroidales bacterium]